MSDFNAELQGIVDLLVELDVARSERSPIFRDLSPGAQKSLKRGSPAVDLVCYYKPTAEGWAAPVLSHSNVGRLTLLLLRALQAGNVTLGDSVSSPKNGE